MRGSLNKLGPISPRGFVAGASVAGSRLIDLNGNTLTAGTGASITNWTDSSGNSHPGTVYPGRTAPTINADQSAFFSSVAGVHALTTTCNLVRPYTIFMVASQPSAAAGQNTRMLQSSTTSSNIIVSLKRGANCLYLNGIASINGPLVTDAGTIHVYTLQCQATSPFTQLFIDGVQQTLGVNSSPGGDFGLIGIGAAQVNEPGWMNLYRLIAYNTFLASGIRASSEAALKANPFA